MSDNAEGLIQYFQRTPKIKAWHIILLGEAIGEKIRGVWPPIPTPPVVTKPPIIEIPELGLPEVPTVPAIPEEIKPKIVQPYSIIENRTNHTIYDPASYDFSVEGMGTLTEFSVVSPSPDFSVQIVLVTGLEGKPVVNEITGSFTEISQYSLYVDELMAFPKDGSYIFGAKNLSFLKSLSIRLIVSEKIIFEKIYIKVDMIKLV